MKPLTIGITGATGNLGRRLTEFVVRKGHHVRCLIRTPDACSRLKNWPVEIYMGDLDNIEVLSKFVSGLDVCLHLAAQVGHALRTQYWRTNIQGTDNLCMAILNKEPNCRLVYCSSIAALQVKPLLPILSTLYARSKYMAEKKILSHSDHNGLRVTIIYPGLIYGQGDLSFVPALLQHLKKQSLFCISGGEKDAPVIYIDDLCELFLHVAQDASDVGGRYSGTGPGEVGIHGFFRLLADQAGCPRPRIKLPKALMFPAALIYEGLHSMLRPGESPRFSRRVVDVLSIRFRASTGLRHPVWRPKTRSAEGIALAWNWYERHLLPD